MSIDYGKFEIFDKLLNNAYHFGFTSVEEVIKATDKVYNSLQETEKDWCDLVPAYYAYDPTKIAGVGISTPGHFYAT